MVPEARAGTGAVAQGGRNTARGQMAKEFFGLPACLSLGELVQHCLEVKHIAQSVPPGCGGCGF